ncbi:hypothetical protein F2Q68_00041227 [Brassica cretica]|uniref:Uncharacterized protein n=1 Tax=Brassica cretica TaxID=69181 RepID=A0A8S9MNF1_BRACR|nr:hypothetical protein F2Q68_00041227 [Brassica cretica]
MLYCLPLDGARMLTIRMPKLKVGAWTKEVWTRRVGDRRVVDKGCVYVDAFDKGMDWMTVEDMSVELNIIFEDRYI